MKEAVYMLVLMSSFAVSTLVAVDLAASEREMAPNDLKTAMISEDEVQVLIAIRTEQVAGNFADALRIMQEEGISARKFQTMLNDVAMLLPYAAAKDDSSRSQEFERLSEEQRRALTRSTKRLRGIALGYVRERGGNEKDLDETIEVIIKHRANLERVVLSEIKESSSKLLASPVRHSRLDAGYVDNAIVSTKVEDAVSILWPPVSTDKRRGSLEVRYTALEKLARRVGSLSGVGTYPIKKSFSCPTGTCSITVAEIDYTWTMSGIDFTISTSGISYSALLHVEADFKGLKIPVSDVPISGVGRIEVSDRSLILSVDHQSIPIKVNVPVFGEFTVYTINKSLLPYGATLPLGPATLGISEAIYMALSDLERKYENGKVRISGIVSVW